MAIKLRELTKKDVGRWVRYLSNPKDEVGRIKSWNNVFVFVVYKCAGDWDNYQNYTAAATKPENLTLY